jgi:hypothetical protein
LFVHAKDLFGEANAIILEPLARTIAAMAAKNKCLSQSNKSPDLGVATNQPYELTKGKEPMSLRSRGSVATVVEQRSANNHASRPGSLRHQIEISNLVRAYGITRDQARRLIKRFGNNRAKRHKR